MSQPDIVEALHTALAQQDGLTDRLIASLTQAHAWAAAALDPAVYEALTWPQNLPDYEQYVRGFVQWIPQENDAKAWRDQSPGDAYAQEISDRIAHYFWLVDQSTGEGDTSIVEDSPVFQEWLTEFARQWGSFLDTPASFSDEILQRFLANAPQYRVEDSLVGGRPNMPSGWLTFNQFFARELNRGLRPIAEPGRNTTVTSPADCSFQHVYEIGSDSEIPPTTVKKTHTYGDIRQLLEGSRYADTFAGGTFVHYMLPPSAYHRFHLPVAGRLEESFVIHGKVVMKVDLVGDQLVASDTTTTGYEFSQTRGVVTLDTAVGGCGDIGIVAVVPVGMSQVGSVVLTGTAGQSMAKGEEFGYFQFGGSDIIVLFQAGVRPAIDPDPAPRHVGSVIARLEAGS